MIPLLIGLHLLAALFWVGGMAFAYTILRPATGPLDPPARLGLWRRVFARFLPWVGVAIIVLLASGYGMVSAVFGGFRGLPMYVNAMQGIGIVMMLLYLHIMFAPWKRFRTAVDGGAFPEAAKNLNQIRILVGINLILGVITVLIGATGKYW
jgi:uncharacterized membrane protein